MEVVVAVQGLARGPTTPRTQPTAISTLNCTTEREINKFRFVTFETVELKTNITGHSFFRQMACSEPGKCKQKLLLGKIHKVRKAQKDQTFGFKPKRCHLSGLLKNCRC